MSGSKCKKKMPFRGLNENRLLEIKYIYIYIYFIHLILEYRHENLKTNLSMNKQTYNYI